MSISAKIVKDSISKDGVRLVTMELNYQRFIHSEFMTHRVFSRNASSSRAIPVEKMLLQVRENAAMPIHWGKNQPGMQAREELCGAGINYAKHQWYSAGRDACHWAKKLVDGDTHKQITNRLLEPFQWIKVIVTATEYDNFFALRCHADAQPEIAQLALRMKEAMEDSIPVELQPGEWHLPYITEEDCLVTTTDNFVKISVARCARVSYLNHDNSTPSVAKDIALADMLLKAGHMSPFEHQATPMNEDKFEKFTTKWIKGVTHYDRNGNYWSGNFMGWLQHRQTL